MLVGCSSGGEDTPGTPGGRETPVPGPSSNASKMPVSLSDAKFQAKLFRLDVKLKDGSPKEAAAAGQQIGGAIQSAGILLFSYDGSEQGRLLVQISDRLDKQERSDLEKKIVFLEKGRKVTSLMVEGWRFQIVGPLKKPVQNGMIDTPTSKVVSSALAPLLPGGFQSSVVEGKKLAVVFAGELKDGGADIERARVALAKALGAKDSDVKVNPLP